MLTSLFVEEWTGFVDIQLSLSPTLRFNLFGKERTVNFPLLSSKVDAYISIGGNFFKKFTQYYHSYCVYIFSFCFKIFKLSNNVTK
jgi:hypothetical protein